MSRKHVLLLESISENAHRLLAEHCHVHEAETPFSGEAIASNHTIHAIITRGKGDVNADLIRQCPQLKVIARCGVGLDNVDVSFASAQGIKVVNAPGSNADTVAEHTLALMLSLQRKLYNSIDAVKKGDWNYRIRYQGDEIRGKTLGILGLGNIGSKVARLAQAFGMQILYWSRDKEKRSIDDINSQYTGLPLDDLFRQSDILTIHLPLTEDTRHLISRQALEQMQPHTLLINTARGDIIDQSALTEALQDGKLGGFAADVLTTEPPADNEPLLQMPQVLITPHSASLTIRTYNEMCMLTVNNTLKLLSGKSIEDRYIFNKLQH